MGIIYPAATSLESPNEEAEVLWKKTSDQTGFEYSGKNTFKSGEGEFTVVGQGDSFKTSHSYLLLTDVPGASANSGATITAKDSNGKQAFVATETRGTTEQEVAVGAGSELKTVLGEGGQSDFPQLTGGAAKRKINRGIAVVKFPGGNNASETLTVSHGLGEAPTAISFCCVGTAAGAGGNYAELTGGATSTQFTVRALNPFTQPAKGAELTVTWLAMS